MPLSFSQLSVYRRCPKQYEFAYIRKLERPQSPAEAFGSSVHNTLKRWGELEQALSDEPGALSDQQTLFPEPERKPQHPQLTPDGLLHFWHQCFRFDAYPTRVEADMARLRGEELLRQFFVWWERQPRHVAAVEKGFSIDVGAVTVSGRFDRVETLDHGLRIIDFKTSAPRSQGDADADVQLSIYALACSAVLSRPCAELVLLFLSEDGVTEIVTHRNASQLADARVQLISIASRIEGRDFHATPSLATCRSCPYRTVCPFSAAGKQL